MTMRAARAFLLCAILAGGGAQAWAMLATLARVDPVAAVSSGRAVVMVRRPPNDILLGPAIARPMFRQGRHPAPVAFDPARPTSDAAVTPATPKPAILVSGIVWGGEPAAVVEGLPGVETAAVLRRGESAGGIRVVRIERDRVVLHGLDTTWNLPVREPWK